MSLTTTLHCTGCGETFTAHPRLLGALCGAGEVRYATMVEAEVASDEDPSAGFLVERFWN